MGDVRAMAAAAVIAVLFIGGVAPSAQTAAAFAVGVLRRDGLLVPFAAFDGHHWKAAWPGPAQMSSQDLPELPISVADIPSKWLGGIDPQSPWTAWMLDGPKRPLRLEQPIEARVFCQTELAVTTDYRGGAFEQAPTVPKDALAVTDGEAVRPVVTVSTLSPDAKRVVDLITNEFNKEEDRATRRFSDWRDPFTPAQRKSYPIDLEAFYRVTYPEYSVSYVEAVRKFPAMLGQRGCGLITFVRGWVIERSGKGPVIDLGATITYCDRAGVSFMQPLGVVQAGDDVYWVYQSSSWTDEAYIVARLRPDGVRPAVVAPGGACLGGRF